MISTIPPRRAAPARRPKIAAADLFCGAGGTSTGLVAACDELGIDVDLLAVNHWPVAIATHSKNHPWAKHLCANLDSIDPKKVVPTGRLDLLVASPECTHHSVARGGRPVSDQSRASAWHVLRWAEHLRIDNILIENVREFRNWGPLDGRLRPMKSRRSETYQAFLSALRSLGYRVEDRVLNAADYGDATTRQRLFIIARRGQRRIEWPDPTHTADDAADSLADSLFDRRARWRSAREIIDWSIDGASIFARKRPLSRSTIDRIAAGLKRFCGEAAEPFLVMLYGTGKAASVRRPLPTVTASGQHIALCQPFIVQASHGGGTDRRAQSVDAPLRTVTTTRDHALVQPFLVPFYGERPGQSPRSHSIDAPLPTQPASNKFALAEPFVISAGGPAGQGRRARSVREPLSTVMADDHKALVTPYLVKFYGNDRHTAQSVREPLDTVTTKDRFALVSPGATRVGLDIRLRMLQPHELARAMGFECYAFTGTRGDQVRQIGNAVPVNTAKALCRAILAA